MVKPGYKQTEIGVIPEDWDIEKLINLSDGGMQNGTFYECSRKGTGVYFLNVGNLYETAPVTTQTLERFDATKDEIDRFRVKNGDLFFTRSSIVPSGIAYCNWYKDTDDKVTVFDSHVVRFKTDTNKVDPMYLYLQCVSQASRRYFVSNAKVATMTTIDQSQIGNCLIPVPSVAEQANIAKAVSDIDGMISMLEKLASKKKAIKQGAMQELLTGKKRLPGFSGEWISTNLGTCLTGKPCYGINAPAVDFNGFLPRYIRITDIVVIGFNQHDTRCCKQCRLLDIMRYILTSEDGEGYVQAKST